MRKCMFLIINFVLLSTLYISNSFAVDVTVKLKAKGENKLEGRKFYISKVVDNRETKGKEIARIEGKASETVLTLENEPEPYFTYFLTVTYPKTERANIPVIMMIHSIECERDSKFLSDKVNITMEIEMVSEKTNQSLFKYRVSNGIQHLISDGRTYGKLIEKDFEDCLKEFNKNF
jgi:hypothetical protein